MSDKSLSLEFVADVTLRQSVQSDYRELRICIEAGAWKAAQVLAGSILEAVLVDTLTQDAGGDAPASLLKAPLSELLTRAEAAGYLTSTKKSLGTGLGEFRNLIHPGRILRVNESVGPEAAKIAAEATALIVNDVGAIRAARHQLTADHLISKLERDPAFLPTFGELLRRTSPAERERFLVDVVPMSAAKWFEDGTFDKDAALQSRLRRAFRLGFDGGSEEQKRKCLTSFVRTIMHDEEATIGRHVENFFRATDLAWCDEKDRVLVVMRVLDTQLWADGYLGKTQLAGLGRFLTEPETVRRFLNLLLYLWLTDEKAVAEQVLGAEYVNMAPKARKEWETLLKKRTRSAAPDELRELYGRFSALTAAAVAAEA